MNQTKVTVMDHYSNIKTVYDMGSFYNVLISMVGKIHARKIIVDLIENKLKSFECPRNKRLFTITYYE